MAIILRLLPQFGKGTAASTQIWQLAVVTYAVPSAPCRLRHTTHACIDRSNKRIHLPDADQCNRKTLMRRRRFRLEGPSSEQEVDDVALVRLQPVQLNRLHLADVQAIDAGRIDEIS